MNTSTTRSITILLALALLGPARASLGAASQVIRDDQFLTLQLGELDGVSLSSDGYLAPAYERSDLGETATEIVWSAIDQGEKGILCATGHEGRLVRLLPGAPPAVLADLPEPEITAMVKQADGGVIFASAPSTTLYRLGTDDKVTTLTQIIGASFVWDLEVDDAGAIWAATGPSGRLFRITIPMAGSTQLDEVQALPSHNLIDLWIDREGLMGQKGAFFIAGQNPGWLYRIGTDDPKPKVVLNSETDEVRAIVPTAKGLLLALNTERAPTPQALNLTLRMAGAPVQGAAPPQQSGGGEGGGQGGGGQAQANAMGDIFAAAQRKGGGSPVSAVVLLTPDGFARPVWFAPERPIHSIMPTASGSILVAAGSKGRLFEVQPNEEFALVADLKQDYLVRLVPTEGGALITSARNGAVSRLSLTRSPKATYTSRVLDAGSMARWGKFYLSGETPQGTAIGASFRTSNTDDTEQGFWSEWSAEAATAPNQPLPLPGDTARYIQYRITFTTPKDSDAAPRADYVELFHQQPNRAPRVKKITIAGAGSPPRALFGGAPAPAAQAQSGGEGGEGGEGGPASGGTPPPPPAPEAAQGAGRRPDSNTKNITITWQAEDPNNDQLKYALYYKAADETDWKLIDDKLRAGRLPLGVGQVADGRYRFRVTVTDELDNPPGQALTGELVSDEVTVDNSPPRVEDAKVETDGNRAHITFRAVDDVSLISTIAVDWDSGDPYPLVPADGLLDQRDEAVDWTTPELPDGEHVVTINLTDRLGNSSAHRLMFKTKK